MLAQQIGPGSELICIEPEPANLVELRRNIGANHLTNGVLAVAAAAVRTAARNKPASSSAGPWRNKNKDTGARQVGGARYWFY